MNTKSIKKSFLLKEKTLGSKELNRSESSSVGGVGHASDELAFGVVGLLLMLCLFFSAIVCSVIVMMCPFL